MKIYAQINKFNSEAEDIIFLGTVEVLGGYLGAKKENDLITFVGSQVRSAESEAWGDVLQLWCQWSTFKYIKEELNEEKAS